ncbi:MAG TPA: alpha/beta fold hydrolase [Pirellulales bacterium]|jgi:alpha-beta hydrolase superfamily lysophospholipase
MSRIRIGLLTLSAALAVLLAIGVGAGQANAQTRVGTTLPPAPPAGAPVVPAPPKIPAPQNVLLKPTYDGVQLSATYYPTRLEKQAAKDAVPVLLLHQWKGSRADYNDLALDLQKAGCAVLVPDLRGHGQSTRRVMPDGKERQIDPAQISKADMEAMAYAEQAGAGDVEVCKSYLMAKNNAGELNIDKLVVVGAEMGASLAVNWSDRDWSWAPLLGAGKQGQFVKAVVLISPNWTFKGFNIAPAVADRDFAANVSWLIAVGSQDSKALSEAKRMQQGLERFLPPPATPGRPLVEFLPYPTSLEGTKLLPTQKLAGEIVKFIDQQVGKSGIQWVERKSPIQ